MQEGLGKDIVGLYYIGEIEAEALSDPDLYAALDLSEIMGLDAEARGGEMIVELSERVWLSVLDLDEAVHGKEEDDG